jgi:hypothetical protein
MILTCPKKMKDITSPGRRLGVGNAPAVTLLIRGIRRRQRRETNTWLEHGMLPTMSSLSSFLFLLTDLFPSSHSLDCQRRKVKVNSSSLPHKYYKLTPRTNKCSGEDTCLHCRARNVRCVYLVKGSRGRRRKATQRKQKIPRNP